MGLSTGHPSPHDLLALDLGHPATMRALQPAPGWARRALEVAPWVVVRRAVAPRGLVAVGVRGTARVERHPMVLDPAVVTRQVPPEDLTAVPVDAARVAALRVLPAVRRLLAGTGWAWGPTGSVGFELATGRPAATEASDLDLLLRWPARVPVPAAARLLNRLHALPVRVDVQVETPCGGVALAEYAAGAHLLARTPYGPELVADLWPARRPGRGGR